MTNLIGQTINKWTIISEAENDKHGRKMYNCICQCGIKRIVMGSNIKRGITKSCGCNSAEKSKEIKTTHGMSRTPTYYCWQSMMRRCYDENQVCYYKYKENKIKVCDRWHEFENFLEDMGERPKKMTLDRIDPLKDYSKDNCRWANTRTQNNNKTNTIFITYNEKTKSLSEWANELNISRTSLYNRIYTRGLDIEIAFNLNKYPSKNRNIPINKYSRATRIIHNALKSGKLIKPNKCEIEGCNETKLEAHHHKGYDEENLLNVQWLCKKHHKRDNENYIEYNNKKQTVADWAREYNIPLPTFRARLKKANNIITDDLFKPLISPSKFIEYKGEKYNMTQLAEKIGISLNGLKIRFNKGWSIEKIIETPPQIVRNNNKD